MGTMMPKEADSSHHDPSRLMLRHPAFPPAVHFEPGGDAVGATLRSVRNLKDEGDILRFSIGLFSALAFLEAEDWPRIPSADDWAIGRDGLPSLTSASGDQAPEEAGRQHAALLYRLLGGKTPPPGTALPSLPHRHRHYAKWNAWLFSALKPDDTFRPSCRQLLLELWNLAAQSGMTPNLPTSWGVGVVWDRVIESWPEGFEAIFSRTRTSMEAVFELASSPDEAGRKLTPVYLGDAPPYPYASLEPLLAGALGTPETARDWMRGHLGEEPEALLASLVELLDKSASDGWLLWPSSALDSKGLALLRRAASSLKRPIVILDKGQGKAAGIVRRIRMLWLTPTAERWYGEHAEALLGEDRETILQALEDLPNDQPVCGSPLMPPVPESLRVPFRPTLGGAGEERFHAPLSRRGEPVGTPQDLASEGYLAELVVRARLEMEEDPAGAALWEGVVFLLLGQPLVALHLWDGLGGTRETKGRLGVLRATCYKDLHDLGRAKKVLQDIPKSALEPPDQETAAFLENQIRWLEGGIEEAAKNLVRMAEDTDDPDVRVQALCHAATALLHANRIERALRLLQQADEAAPFQPHPATAFLLTHRRAMAHRKIGDYATALKGFEMAREVVSTYGFRGLEVGCECDCGNALRLLCRFKEASGCYRRAEEGATGLGLEALVEDARFNLALCRFEAGDVQRARHVFESTLDTESPDQNPLFTAISLLWLATVHQALGDYPKALDLAEKGLKLMNRVADPEVRIPLLVLRGELLLLTGQRRKLSYLCRELKSTLKPETDPDDLLAASAVRCAASAKGSGEFSPGDRKAALELLPQASPYFRAYWHLLVGEYVAKNSTEELQQAWLAAREARSPFLSSRVLWSLAERGGLPALSENERKDLAAYLTKNRVKGPERQLLPLLAGNDEDLRGEKRAPVSDDIALLLAAGEEPDGTFESVLKRVGADAACLVRVGRPPHWWGTCTAVQRRLLLAGAGHVGELPSTEGGIIGVKGVGGTWCGFFRAGREAFLAEQKAFARIWVRMLRDPPPQVEPRNDTAVHPAVRARIITKADVMVAVLQSLSQAAGFTFPVLLTGEPGVGKEACAQALHAASPRAGRAWVAANCANLTPTLAASLLFGHKKGAFTGAAMDQQGLVEAARDSTLFLDEVGELPPEVQASLLRFLQDGSFLPLGEVRPRASNARILAATNKDLEAAVREGSFREDLFHRLNVIRVHIPPLRRRAEDVPDLLTRFLAQAAEKENLPTPAIDPSVLSRLGGYAWPGNVRELQNLAKALLVASNGDRLIVDRHLPDRYLSPVPAPCGSSTLAEILKDAERTAIQAALEESGGNLSQAARSLAISRQNLLQKVRRLGLRKA